MRMPTTPAELEAAIRQMRDEVTMHGARELLTPSDVDAALKNQKGTALVFINSVCGCAARGARSNMRMLAVLNPLRAISSAIGP